MKILLEIENGNVRTKILEEDKPKEEEIKDGVFCKKGDKSSNVNFLQSLINRFKGKKLVSEDGDFGQKTEEALIHVLSEMRIPYNGAIMKDHVELILKAIGSSDPSPDSLSEKYDKKRHLSLLQKFVILGWREGVGSKAWNMFQKEWINAGYPASNWAWCATAQHEILDQAGLNLPYFFKQRTFALVSTFVVWAKEQGFWVESNPQPCDLFITRNSSGYNHIGAVLDVVGNNIVTSEGNSSDMYLSRKMNSSKPAGYIRIPDGYRFYKI